MQSLLRTLAFGVILAILAPATALTAQTTDRAIGTWKLNVAKSKYDLGPAPKSLTVTFEKVGQGVRVTTKGVDGQGNPTATGYTANYDGKDYSVTGAAGYDMVSLTLIDPSTVQVTRKKAGKVSSGYPTPPQVVATVQRVVSPDGKVLTVTTTGTNAQGHAATDVGVFERQ